MDQTSQTLKLVAFIFALIATIATGIVIIPLAWTIPMTIHLYNAYKGKQYSLAFAICSLLFLNTIAGILLIVDYVLYESKKSSVTTNQTTVNQLPENNDNTNTNSLC